MRFLFLLFVMCFVVSFSAKAQNICADAALSEEVAAALLVPDRAPQTESVIKQVEIGVSKGVLKADQRDNAVAAFLEYAMRHSRKCHIPDALRLKISQVIAITKEGAEICAADQFKTIIDRQYKALEASDGYDVFEAVIKGQIESNIIPSARGRFIQRWDADGGFRARVIKTGLELNVMYSNGCANLQDPILGILAEF